MRNTSDPTPDLLVEACAAADIRTLFPLMREVSPMLELQPWLLYARNLLRTRGARSGILVARRRANRFPCGAVCYRLERDIRYSLVLNAEHYITLDLLYPRRVLQALEHAVDVVAANLGCGAVRAFVPSERAALTESLLQAGYRDDGTALLKTPALPSLSADITLPAQAS